ncbi:MAG: DMT family transporter, partial [Chloroflexi bacterium]|nr:DMT family transporter [Chloroflexota bacterium]
MRADSRPPGQQARLVGIGLVVASAAAFGSGPFFARVAYDAGMTALPLLTWRFVFAAVVAWLLLLATGSGRRSLRSIGRRRLIILLALGVLYVGNAGSFTAALASVPVSLVSIIAFLYPALVAVLSVRFVRRLEGRRAWVALAVSTLGIALAVGGIPAGADIPLAGLLLAFTCPIVYAIWIVLAARLGGERPDGDAGDIALVIAPMDAESVPDGPDVIPSTALMTSATAVGAGLLTLVAGDSLAPTDVPADAWLALLCFGAFSALAFRWFLAGTRRIGAARAALQSPGEAHYPHVRAPHRVGAPR